MTTQASCPEIVAAFTRLAGALALIMLLASGADALRTWAPDMTISRGDLTVTFPRGEHGPVVRLGDCVIFRNCFFKVRSGDYHTSYFGTDNHGNTNTSLDARRARVDGCPALVLDLAAGDHDYEATYRMVLEDERTLRVEYVQRAHDMPDAHLEFCPLIIEPNAVIGRVAQARWHGGGRALLMPMKPRPHDERFFDLPPLRSLTLHSRASRVEIETIGNTPGFGLVDFRASQYAGAEALRGILLYGRHRVPEGEQLLGLRLTFAEPERGPEPTPEMLREARMVEQPPPDRRRRAHLIVPHPQRVRWGEGSLPLEGATVRVPDGVDDALRARIAALPLAAEIETARSPRLPETTLAISADEPGGDLAPDLPDALQPWQRDEAYRLSITPEAAILTAEGPEGLWHGWLTLVQLTERGGAALPVGEIVDWPALRFRGFHFNPRVVHPNVELAEALIETCARLKMTHVVMQFKGRLELRSHPEGVDPERHWTRAQIERLVERAEELGVEAVPEMKLIGHARWAHGGGTRGKPLEEMPHLQDMFNPAGTCFCPRSEQAAELATSVIDEVIDIFHDPSIFHISGDEAGGWATCERCRGEDGGELFARWVNLLHDHLAERGIRTMMWGDMLLRGENYPDFTAAHALRGTEQAIEDLPRDIIIADWHYGGNEQFPSARYFDEQGFDVVGCPWSSRQGIINWGRQLAAEDSLGMLATSWHTLLADLDTVAVAAEAGWQPDTAAERVDAYDATALVQDSVERLSASDLQVAGQCRPIDLTPHATRSLRDDERGDGAGWLDFGPLRDLRDFPTGEVTLVGVPFVVPAGERNAVMLRSPIPPCDALPPAVEGVTVGSRTARLHLLCGHGFDAFGRPEVMSLRLTYAEGESDTVPLQAGMEVRHWLASGLTSRTPTEPCSLCTAWRGRTRDGTPARMYLLSVATDPQRVLQSVSLLSGDAQVPPFVLALTAELPPQ